MASPPDITALLGDWSRGDRTALNQLLSLVYAELRRAAARQLRRERPDHTLQPTALVHEVYLRLVDQRQVDWRNRAHFFGVAAQVMRRVLVDHARRHMPSSAATAYGVCPSTMRRTSPHPTRSRSSHWIRHSSAWSRSTLSGQDRRASRVRRAHDQRSGPCPRRVPLDRQPRLAHCESLAPPRTRFRPPSVTDSSWPRVKALFEAAVQWPIEQRHALLVAETGDDEALRREVESLLASDALEGSFLDPYPRPMRLYLTIRSLSNWRRRTTPRLTRSSLKVSASVRTTSSAASGRRWNGRGLPGARHEARARGRAESPARSLRARCGAAGTLPPRGASARFAQPSEHRGDLWAGRVGRRLLSRAGAGSGENPGRADRMPALSMCARRCESAVRLQKGSKRRTTEASSTGT